MRDYQRSTPTPPLVINTTSVGRSTPTPSAGGYRPGYETPLSYQPPTGPLARGPARIVVDNDFVDEWDALTGEVRMRPIDARGVVTDEN